MKRTSKLFISTALTAIALTCSARDSVTPKLAGAVGDSWAYKVRSFIVTNSSVGTTLEGTVTHEVLAAGSSSQLVVRETPKDFMYGSGASGRLDKQVSGLQAITATYRLDGTIAKIEGGPVQSAAYRLANLETISLPGVPFAANYTWSWHTDGDAKRGIVPVTASYRVVGSDTASGFDAWKIEFSNVEQSPEPESGGAEAKVSGTAWLRKADCKLLGLQDQGTNLPVPNMDSSVTVNRQITVTFIPELEIHAPAAATATPASVSP